MENLPEDIIIDTLSMLPVKSVSRFRCVCKDWYKLFRNPKFIKAHLHQAVRNNKFSILLKVSHASQYVHYTIEDFDVTSSSYNMVPVKTNLPPDTYDYGDIFLSDYLIGLLQDGNKICLWNPSTREYRYMPTLNSKEAYIRDRSSKYGVCYDWKIDDYKLFELVASERYGDISSEIWVSRLGSNSWKCIGNIPYDVDRIRVSMKPLNGIIHWIGDTKVILSFDIVQERASEIQIPSCYLNNGSYPSEYMEVGVLGEYLYLLVNSLWPLLGNMSLWVMKDYGVTNSWTKIFSLPKCTTSFASLRPLHYHNKNREILLQGVNLEDTEDVLVSYDLISRRLVTLDIPCMPKRFTANTIVGSLVSLNSGKFQKAEEISMVDTRHGAESGEFIDASDISKVDTRHGAESGKFLEASEISKVETKPGADSGELVKAENISKVNPRHGYRVSKVWLGHMHILFCCLVLLCCYLSLSFCLKWLNKRVW